MQLIDVSEYQGLINWNEIKGHIDGAIIRCGYGNDIASQDDKQWKRNADECTRLGIPFGTYLYSYATNQEQIQSEAQHVLRLIKGYELSFPIYLDLEFEGARANAPILAEQFGNLIEKEGYWCGIYADESWWESTLSGLVRFTKWVASYGINNGNPGVKPNLGEDIWQYTSQGRMVGISGNVDLNLCYKDFPNLIRGEDKKPTGYRYKIGQNIVFSTCYESSTAPISQAIQASDMIRNHGVITRIQEGARNPYLLDNGLCWVNDGDIRGFYQEKTEQYYTIQEGDTLSGIAEQFHTSISQLQQWNQIENPNLIYAGEKIRVQ